MANLLTVDIAGNTITGTGTVMTLNSVAAKQDLQTTELQGVNTKLTTIDGRVDTLETLIASTNTKLDTIEISVDAVTTKITASAATAIKQDDEITALGLLGTQTTSAAIEALITTLTTQFPPTLLADRLKVAVTDLNGAELNYESPNVGTVVANTVTTAVTTFAENLDRFGLSLKSARTNTSPIYILRSTTGVVSAALHDEDLMPGDTHYVPYGYTGEVNIVAGAGSQIVFSNENT